jgi:hypothetical protein
VWEFARIEDNSQRILDTDEGIFYENVVSSNQIRNGELYKNEKQELFGEFDEFLKGISLWRRS